MQACKIDETGLFIEDVLGVSQETIDADETLAPGPAPGGFFKPRWDGLQWGEGDPDAQQKRLDTALATAVVQIDNAAEAARARYATLMLVQGATYRSKEQWAKAFADAGYPEASIADYPYIAEESSRTGQSGQAVADRVLANAAAWENTDRINPRIEAERTGGKGDCRAAHAAGDLAGLESARDNAVATLAAV